MLRIQNVKINDYIRKNFCIKTRLFPMLLRHSILYAPDIRLFVSIRSGRDRQRPYCEHNFGVLYYEGISSPFLLFKFYLDILGRINFNLRDKHLLPIMLNNQYLLARKNYSARKKFKEDIYIFTVKLIKRLVVSTCQVVNPHMFPHVFENYKVGVNCYNPYLSIDRHRQEKKKMNSLCTLLTEAISNKFNIDVKVFISKKKKHSHLFLKKKICMSILITDI